MAGSIHFSKDLPEEFYAQITAEKLITRYSKGHPIQEWVKPSHRRNEVLDCTVYALAAAYHLGMNKFSERDWSRLEEIVQPIPDYLVENNEQKLDENEQKVEKNAIKEHKVKNKVVKKPRRRSDKAGFVSRW